GTGCIGTGSDMTVKSRQAQTKLAIKRKYRKVNGQKCGGISHQNIQTARRAANATKQLREKSGEKAKSQRQISNRRLKNKRRLQLYLTYGSLLKGQYTFSRTQCVQATRLTINKIEKIGINKSENGGIS